MRGSLFQAIPQWSIALDLLEQEIPLMKLAVIQSNYIPWPGYFQIILNADLVCFYDDVNTQRMTGETEI